MNNKWVRAAIPALLSLGAVGSVYAFSLFVKPISDYIGRSQGAVQFAFSLAIFFLGMAAAFGGRIVEKDIHKSTIIGTVLFCSGLFVTALAIYIKSLLLLYIGYGALVGTGTGITYLSPVKTLMLWFSKNKGLATGISVCAFGFGSTIASPLITFFNARVPLYCTFIILSGIYFLPMLVAHFLLQKPNDWVEARENDDGFKMYRMWTDSKFRLIWIIVFINITSGLALISTASPIMTEKGIEAKTIALTVSVMGVFNGAGRLIFSAVSDKFKDRKLMYQIIALLSICSVGLVIAIKAEWAVIVSLAIISACYGAGFSCLPSMLADIYGMKNISKIHGLALSAWAMAGLVGNQISNLIHNITGSYDKVFIVLIILYTIELMTTIRLRFKR